MGRGEMQIHILISKDKVGLWLELRWQQFLAMDRTYCPNDTTQLIYKSWLRISSFELRPTKFDPVTGPHHSYKKVLRTAILSPIYQPGLGFIHNPSLS